MTTFRTAIANYPSDEITAIAKRDIVELDEKIQLFETGKIDPEKFRSLRLARGIYGQRQPGVQMVRIKIPYGKLSVKQIRKIADLTDEFSTGNIHLTTRQDVQLYFVSLDRTPELWAEIEKDNLTLREACGNTVRNITTSATAGIDLHEPFDVTPYSDALYNYFLRHPAGQDLPRKIKIAFSSSEADSAVTFIHDIGFIPRVEIINKKITRGFKVLIGGGLGAQAFLSKTAYEFLPAEEIIPFTEALLRVFDRFGERNNRLKARLKYFVNQIGLDEVLKLVEVEKLSLPSIKIPIEGESTITLPQKKITEIFTTFRVSDSLAFLEWKKANVFPQKQNGWFGVYVKISLGNILSEKARSLATVVERYAADDVRVTIGQSFLLRFVSESALPALYNELTGIGLATTGGNALADIASCPGTDTCNLAISNSTGVALEFEKTIREEFPELVAENNLSIKISGCMNSCSQHGLAQIGFHGSSIKAGNFVLPALQLVLGGGITGSGNGRVAEKILKFPSKRAPAVLRTLLSDFRTNAKPAEVFNDYYDRVGKNYFYLLLKPFSDLRTVKDAEFIDWNQEQKYASAIGVGECAGVKIDLVATLLLEAEEAFAAAQENFSENRFADAVYKAYNTFIHVAKSLLLTKGIHVNTQHGVIADFEKEFQIGFKEKVLQINKNTPTKDFASKYIIEAKEFLKQADSLKTKHSNAN
ncbi:MAG: HEPN domain-containing protein [Bacteroidetes bacterium]|nr:HEPN domain-containing protein [Bacteroidota bacterium]